MNIILPIHKKYIEMIFTGWKTVEFRKTWPVCKIEKVYLLETKSGGIIRGYFEPGKTYEGYGETLIEICRQKIITLDLPVGNYRNIQKIKLLK